MSVLEGPENFFNSKINFVAQYIYYEWSPIAIEGNIYGSQQIRDYPSNLREIAEKNSNSRYVLEGVLDSKQKKVVSSSWTLVSPGEDGYVRPIRRVLSEYNWYVIQPFYKSYFLNLTYKANDVRINMNDCFDTDIVAEYTIINDFLERSSTVQKDSFDSFMRKGPIIANGAQNAVPGVYVLRFICTWRTKEKNNTFNSYPTYTLGTTENPIQLNITILEENVSAILQPRPEMADISTLPAAILRDFGNPSPAPTQEQDSLAASTTAVLEKSSQRDIATRRYPLIHSPIACTRNVVIQLESSSRLMRLLKNNISILSLQNAKTVDVIVNFVANETLELEVEECRYDFYAAKL